MGKKLAINCGTAIMIDEKSKALDGFSALSLNTGSALIARTIHEKLCGIGAAINAGTIHVVDDIGEVVKVGDTAIIDGRVNYTGKFILSMGSVHLREGAVNSISGATGIYAQKIYSPQSLEIQSRCKLYGEVIEYPDGAAVMTEKNWELEHGLLDAFPNGSTVFVEGTITALNDMTVAKARQRGLKFQCGKLVAHGNTISENNGMFTAGKYINVPDGHTYVKGNLTLNRMALAIHGSKIFVDGNVYFDEEYVQINDGIASFHIQSLESLRLSGDIYLPIDQIDTFKAIGKAKTIIPYEGKLLTINGTQKFNHEFFDMSRAKNTRYTLRVNGKVTFEADVTEEDLDSLLDLHINGVLVAPEAMKLSLLMRAGSNLKGVLKSLEDIKEITEADEEDDEEEKDTVSINVGVYIM